MQPAEVKNLARDIQSHTLSLGGRSRGKLNFYVFIYMPEFHLRPCTIFINKEKAMNIVYISKSPISSVQSLSHV